MGLEMLGYLRHHPTPPRFARRPEHNAGTPSRPTAVTGPPGAAGGRGASVRRARPFPTAPLTPTPSAAWAPVTGCTLADLALDPDPPRCHATRPRRVHWVLRVRLWPSWHLHAPPPPPPSSPPPTDCAGSNPA